MRARLCITAGYYSPSSAMSSSSRTSPARGLRPRGRGFCEGPRLPDQWGRRGVLTRGGACWRTVNADNYGNHGAYGGNAGDPRTVMGPPPDPGYRFRSPYPGPHPLPPPSYGRSLTQGSWCPPSLALCPQRPPVYGPPPPRNPLQAPPRELRPPPPRQRRLADYRRSWVSSSLPLPPPECERFRVMRTGNAVDGCAIFWRTDR
ncbi:hypothetical protein Taro_031802 [Colocasia esculenta]|uniref:Uncharacterized protein n=1 Tax=Colocasia esculenta TaxID=4460 RepID=A0A843VQZ9_COLES|nr:hypothetical protein [Colocasia esculenta]